MRTSTLVALVAASLPLAAYAQGSVNSTATSSETVTTILPAIPLYQSASPKTPKTNYEEETVDLGGQTLFNVTDPTITPVLPSKAVANGTAVIIAPGGGYYILSIEEEGMREARWLADRGFTVFVLKYRTRPVDPKALATVVPPFLGKVATPGSDVYKLVDFEPAVADGAMALRTVRDQAGHWGINPKRVVFMGFSAGAFTTLRLATSKNTAERPDYVVPVYPSLDSIAVPKDAPPMYGVIALDDKLFGNRGFGLLTAWQASGRPFEFHLHERGGHAFGMGTPGTTTMNWMDGLYSWLKMKGLTDKP